MADFALAEDFRRSLLDSGLVPAGAVEQLADYLAEHGPVVVEYWTDYVAAERSDAERVKLMFTVARMALGCGVVPDTRPAAERHKPLKVGQAQAIVAAVWRLAEPPTASPTLGELPSVAAMGKLLRDNESGRRDLNPRPPEPHRE